MTLCSVDWEASAGGRACLRCAAIAALSLAWVAGASIAWCLVGPLDDHGLLADELGVVYGPYQVGRRTVPLVAIATGACLVLLLFVVWRSPLRQSVLLGVGGLLVLGAMSGVGWRVLTASANENNIGAGLALLVEPVLVLVALLFWMAMSGWILTWPAKRPQHLPGNLEQRT